MYHDEDYVERFLEHNEAKASPLYTTLPSKSMIKLTDMIKMHQKAAEKCHICF